MTDEDVTPNLVFVPFEVYLCPVSGLCLGA